MLLESFENCIDIDTVTKNESHDLLVGYGFVDPAINNLSESDKRLTRVKIMQSKILDLGVPFAFSLLNRFSPADFYLENAETTAENLIQVNDLQLFEELLHQLKLFFV